MTEPLAFWRQRLTPAEASELRAPLVAAVGDRDGDGCADGPFRCQLVDRAQAAAAAVAAEVQARAAAAAERTGSDAVLGDGGQINKTPGTPEGQSFAARRGMAPPKRQGTAFQLGNGDTVHYLPIGPSEVGVSRGERLLTLQLLEPAVCRQLIALTTTFEDWAQLTDSVDRRPEQQHNIYDFAKVGQEWKA